MEPMKVFIVSSGSYSDYHILGIYSTREKAEHAKKLYASDNEIEEFNLDEIPNVPPGLFLYGVHMNKNGDVKEAKITYAADEYLEWHPFSGYGEPVVCFNVFAEDEAHAIKIANEKRIQLIAENIWTGDYSEFFKQGLNRLIRL